MTKRVMNPTNMPDLPGEEWRGVPGWEDLYSVSSFGRVKNRNGRILHPPLQWNGYVGIVFVTDSGRVKRYLIHRLVALAFLPNPEEHATVDHIDGNKTINHVANLEWVPQGENQRRAIAMGLAQKPPRRDGRGARNNQAKLTEEQVLAILDTPKRQGSGKALALQYGVSPATITSIRRGHRWKHLRQS